MFFNVFIGFSCLTGGNFTAPKNQLDASGKVIQGEGEVPRQCPDGPSDTTSPNKMLEGCLRHFEARFDTSRAPNR